MQRPSTIHAVSVAINNGVECRFAFKEFLDEFISEPSLGKLSVEPDYVADDVSRVYLAGAAEQLAQYIGKPTPSWCDAPCYFLNKVTVLAGDAARDMIMAETPGPFRRRLLFCGQTLTKFRLYYPQ